MQRRKEKRTMNDIGLGQGSNLDKRRKVLHQGLKAAVYGIPLLGAIGFILSAVLGFYIVISIFKNKEY